MCWAPPQGPGADFYNPPWVSASQYTNLAQWGQPETEGLPTSNCEIFHLSAYLEKSFQGRMYNPGIKKIILKTLKVGIVNNSSSSHCSAGAHIKSQTRLSAARKSTNSSLFPETCSHLKPCTPVQTCNLCTHSGSTVATDWSIDWRKLIEVFS